MYSSLTKPSSSTVADESGDVNKNKENNELFEKNISDARTGTENKVPDLNGRLLWKNKTN